MTQVIKEVTSTHLIKYLDSQVKVLMESLNRDQLCQCKINNVLTRLYTYRQIAKEILNSALSSETPQTEICAQTYPSEPSNFDLFITPKTKKLWIGFHKGITNARPAHHTTDAYLSRAELEKLGIGKDNPSFHILEMEIEE